jgi:NADPH:quinone reductase-like Zn-dependent oxidoreductase
MEPRRFWQYGRGRIRSRDRATGVNFADVMARMGLYQAAPAPPCVVGYEVAGTAAAVGAEVTTVRVGDRVMAGTRFGGYAERAATHEENVVRLPDAMSFEQGAAVPVNYVTAAAGLLLYGNLQRGERVLIHAAAGGVGIAATQIAKRHGAAVFGSASPGKHAAIRRLGVDHPIDYTRPGWERGLPSFDLVMDAIGGASFRTSYRLLRAGGRLICFGASAVVSGETRNLLTVLGALLRTPRFNPLKLMDQSKAVIDLNLLALWDDRGTLGSLVRAVQELVDDGTVQPVVAQAYPFERAADGHRLLSARGNTGKVVLLP